MTIRQKQQGLSLVELMISITLGLVILAGVATVFLNSRQGYAVQEGTALMQDNARFALETVGRALRDAGFFHGVPPAGMEWMDPALNDVNAAPCASDAWFANTRNAIEIHGGGAQSPVPGCTLNSYVAGTDVLVVRHADANSAPATGYLPRANVADVPPDALMFRAIPASRGAIYKAGNLAAVSNRFTGDDETDGVFDYRLRARVFHVGVPGDAGNAGAALYERSEDFGAVTSQPVISGVEQFQLLAGLDIDGDRSVDRWIPSTDIDESRFADIVATRVALIVRGDALDDFTDDQTYELPDGTVYTPPETVRRYPRRLYIQDFQVRNRVRG